MRTEHVSRLICIMGIGARKSAGHGGVLFDTLIFPLLLRNLYADENRRETLFGRSALAWGRLVLARRIKMDQGRSAASTGGVLSFNRTRPAVLAGFSLGALIQISGL